MGQDLWNMEFGQVGALLRQLGKFGVTPEHIVRAMKYPDYLRLVANSLMTVLPGIQYDASDVCHTLRFANGSTSPSPTAQLGEVIIWKGEWSLDGLLSSTELGSKIVEPQEWYRSLPWYKTVQESAYYRLRLGIPGSAHKDPSVSAGFLPSNENYLPVCVGATAWIVHYLATKQDLFGGKWLYCQEQSTQLDRVIIGATNRGTRLCVSHSSGACSKNEAPWMASCVKIS